MDRVLAVDIGGTKTAVGIVSAHGIVLAKDTAPTPRGDPEAVRDCVAALAARVLGRDGPVESAGARVRPDFVRSELGDESACIGAAALVLENMLTI